MADRGSSGAEVMRNRSYTSPPFRLRPAAETLWISWLVPMFVVANIILFIVVMCINNCPQHSPEFRGKCVGKFLGRLSFQPLKENPLFGPSSSTLENVGALKWTNIVQKHQGWRLFTAIWLHGGLIHLISSMFSLVFIGVGLEQLFGFVRIGIVYIVSGIAGSVLSSLFLQNSISVGASGALFGLIGAMLSELLTNWTIYTNKAAALFTLLVIAVINSAIGILPHVDNFTHIGGFITGFLLGFVLLPRPHFGGPDLETPPAHVPVKSKYRPHQYVLWLASLALLIVGFTSALVMLFRGKNGNDYCHVCHKLSCVSSSRWSCD